MDFSPGCEGIGDEEELERKKGKGGSRKLKGKRDYKVGSEFSPGCEPIGDEEELERGKGKKEKGITTECLLSP